MTLSRDLAAGSAGPAFARVFSYNGGQMKRRSALLSLFALILLSANALAQDKPDLEKQRREEAADRYRKWLDEDVVYIITDEERGVFEGLSTDDERDAFIEQFWFRRDPDPETAENEFREEHYRRLAYANDHFSIGVPGWKSDRGRIYIINGPPDSTEHHDQGEQYYRPNSEGGGVTTTYAWEVWSYRNLPGIGDGIDIEFVDKTMSGHYVLARDEMDKDAFLWVPGLGLTEAERLGGAEKAERIGTRTMANFATRRIGNPLKMFSQKDDLFERLRRYTKLQAAPEIKFKDLEGLVDVQLYYNRLPFQVRQDLVRVTAEDYLVPITFYFDSNQFNFVPKSDDLEEATLNVYGRVETLTKRKVYAFDDEVFLRRSRSDHTRVQNSVFQRAIPLQAGRYKLVAVVKDGNGGKIGTLEQGISVPEVNQQTSLDLSPVILADRVQPAKDGEFISDPFVLGTVKVYPSPRNEFTRGSPLGFYFEVYNVAADQQTLEPDLGVDLKISHNGKPIPLPFSNLSRLLHRYADRFFAGSMLSTQPLEPGDYAMTIAVTDRVAGSTAEKTVKFRIMDAS